MRTPHNSKPQLPQRIIPTPLPRRVLLACLSGLPSGNFGNGFCNMSVVVLVQKLRRRVLKNAILRHTQVHTKAVEPWGGPRGAGHDDGDESEEALNLLPSASARSPDDSDVRMQRMRERWVLCSRVLSVCFSRAAAMPHATVWEKLVHRFPKAGNRREAYAQLVHLQPITFAFADDEGTRVDGRAEASGICL